MVSRRGASKLGTLLRGAGPGCVSGTSKEIMSTILETSFLMVSGRVAGISRPVRRKLHRYMANANSGKNSCPDLVESDRTQILERSLPGSFERIRRSRALSPIHSISKATPQSQNIEPTIHSLTIANRRLEKLLELSLILSRDERKPNTRNLRSSLRRHLWPLS